MALAIAWQYDVSGLPIDEYTRVSVDKKGRSKSVPDQHDDNMDCADEQDIKLGEWFNDGDHKATLGAKERPEWNAYLNKVRAGRSGGLLLYDVSRASRDLGIGYELVKIVRECGLKGFRVISSSTGRVFDLSKEMEANDYQDELVKAERQALIIQTSSRRGMKRKARRGELTGGQRRRFGFLDANNNVHQETERDLLREARQRVTEDLQLDTTVKAWRERSIVTPEIRTNDGSRVVYAGGVEIDHRRLKALLLRPINAGYSRWVDGELVGRLPGEETIFTEEEYLELREILENLPKGRPATKVHMLTGPRWELLRCGPCRAWMAGTVNGDGVTEEMEEKGREKRSTYICRHRPRKDGPRRGSGCQQSIDMPSLDAMIEAGAYAWWFDPERLARDIVIQPDTAEVRALDGKLETLRTRHARLITSTAPGVDASLSALEQKIASLAAERETLASPTTLRKAARDELLKRWNGGEASRRKMIKEAYRVIEIWPPDTGTRQPRHFDSNRVRAWFADEADPDKTEISGD